MIMDLLKDFLRPAAYNVRALAPTSILRILLNVQPIRNVKTQLIITVFMNSGIFGSMYKMRKVLRSCCLSMILRRFVVTEHWCWSYMEYWMFFFFFFGGGLDWVEIGLKKFNYLSTKLKLMWLNSNSETGFGVHVENKTWDHKVYATYLEWLGLKTLLNWTVETYRTCVSNAWRKLKVKSFKNK